MSEKSDQIEFMQEQLVIQEALHRVKKQDLRLRPFGRCHNCEEKVGQDMVFCDQFCAEDHAKIERANKQRVY